LIGLDFSLFQLIFSGFLRSEVSVSNPTHLVLECSVLIPTRKFHLQFFIFHAVSLRRSHGHPLSMWKIFYEFFRAPDAYEYTTPWDWRRIMLGRCIFLRNFIAFPLSSFGKVAIFCHSFVDSPRAFVTVPPAFCGILRMLEPMAKNW